MEKQPHIHHIEAQTPEDEELSKAVAAGVHVQKQLLEGDDIVLIPTPSDDPRDPLNYPSWKKWSILLLVSAYGATSVILVSGMGAIFTAVAASYPGQEARATDLLTYPTLFMGIGNLIGMPLALAIGRRPVFLGTVVILVLSGIWCALSDSNLSSHIAARNIMSLAAGQSEALAPMIVQEVHFLHERGAKLAWFMAVENIAVGAFFVASQYLVASYGWKWWYGLFTVMNGVILVLSFLLLAETAFDRSNATIVDDRVRGEKKTLRTHVIQKSQQKWSDGLKLVAITPRFDKIPAFFVRLVQGFGMPTVMWALVLNGTFLGLYVFCASTFATILIAEYAFSFTNLAYVQAAQIIVCLLFLPLLGYGGDWIIKLLSRRNGSFYKPEYRLFPLVVSTIVVVVCAIIYGQAATGGWRWWDVAITYNATLFAFMGANIVGITYTVDSFPTRAGPLLVLLCAGRGIISFGLSYSTLPAVKTLGYHGITLVYGVLCGVFALAGGIVYFYGPRLRMWSGRVMKINAENEDNID